MRLEERIAEQRVNELEFRVQTLEKAVLAMAERLAVTENFINKGPSGFWTTFSKRKRPSNDQ